MLSFDYGNILAGIFFGAIGIGAFRYGKRNQIGRHMVLGILLMVFPYFVPGTLPAIAVGALLTGLLFWP